MQKWILILFFAPVLLAVPAVETLSTTKGLPGSSPADVVLEFLEALNNADMDTLMEKFASDATLFVPFDSSPGRVEGKEAIAVVFQPMFASLRETRSGPRYMKLTPRAIRVQTHGDTAVVTFHIGNLPDGPVERAYNFSRRTLVMVRSDDGWQIVHLHASNIMIPVADPG